MQVFIRFLALGSPLKKDFAAFTVPEHTNAEMLLDLIESSGRAGVFCAASDWTELPEQVLLASDAHMLRPGDSLREGQQISIIGPMIGG